jgi:hypothetical protein
MKPGVHHNVPFEDYLAWPHVSKSLLVEMLRSPGHLQYRRAHPLEPTPAMVWGSALDCLVFEGRMAFDRRFVVRPDGIDLRTMVGKAWAASLPIGLQSILGDPAVIDAAHAVDEHPEAGPMIRFGRAQVSAAFDCPHTGVRVKIRPDIVCETTALADLKSTDRADPDSFARRAYQLRYHWQAAIYLDGMSAATGEDYDEFSFIVVERDPPHRVEVYRLGLAEIEQGREEYRAALAMYADCEKTNKWPTTTGRIQPLTFPDWATR